MGQSSGVTGLLDLAIAKASSLPDSQQDVLAREILLKISGEDETFPTPEHGDIGTAITLLALLMPGGNVARAITLILCAFALFVLAPRVVLSGISEVIRSTRPQPNPDPGWEPQARDRQGEGPADGGGNVAAPVAEAGQAPEGRPVPSTREEGRLEAYYALREAGLFDQETVLHLAKAPAQSQAQFVSTINRAISSGPCEVSAELNTFLLAVETLMTGEYTVSDMQEYRDARERVADAMRKALELDRQRPREGRDLR